MAIRNKLVKSGTEETVNVVRSNRTMRFASLHHHSTFSYLDGYGLPEDHMRRAAELGYKAMALTEHGNVSSHVRMEEVEEETGVKPVFGCELYAGEVGNKATQRKNHLTVLAEDQEGYRNLLRLVSRAWSEGFYYSPTVSGRMLAEYRKGLFVLSGCTASLLATSLIGGKNIDPKKASYRRARKVAQRFKDIFGDRFFLEVQQFPELAATRNINPAYEQLSKELGISLVATADVHYCHGHQNVMQKILHNVRGGSRQTMEQQEAEFEYSILLSHPTSDKEVYQRLRYTGLSKQAAIDAILNTEMIAEACNVRLPRMDMVSYPLPPGTPSPEELFRQWLNEGWLYRGFNKLPKKERERYIKQVKYESKIMIDKGFLDYFLIVSDLVKFAKDHGIPVGPARGSAAASLVCYLLRITEVNPMLFPTLVFERFIDVTREDLPDIDLDFDDELRMRVWEYAEAKYGNDRVGTIGSFVGYKGKNSLDDVARAFGIPDWEVKKVKDLMIERSGGDLRADATIEDTAKMFPQVAEVFERYPDLRYAQALEGNYKGMSVHAAGLVISPRPITDVCAVYEREVAGERRSAIAYDKYDAERMGLLKIDALGLSTMGMIRMALEMIGMTLEELYALPLDDEDTIQGFRENDVVGVFQFDGRAMRSVNEVIRADSFEEVCAVTALSRPGPLHNNATTDYMDIKKGVKEVEVKHPLLRDITSHTYGQIVYQEQILRIVMEIGGFDWTHSAHVRRIMSKKLGEQEFNRQWERFRDGAKERGMSEADAKTIWGLCITAGAYAFNAAHSVSYGMISYWTMWLKRHYPEVFYACALTKLPDNKENNRHVLLMRDATKKGIKVSPPSPQSGLGWSYTKGEILAGLTQISGIGDKTASAMIRYREECDEAGEPLEDWDGYIAVKGIGVKTIDKIKDFCAKEDPFDVTLLERRLRVIKEMVYDTTLHAANGLPLPMPTHTAVEVPGERSKDVQVVWMGVITHRNVRDLYEVNFSRTGVALNPDEVKDPHLNEWIIMRAEDDTEQLQVTIDRWRYPRFRKALWEMRLGHDIVLIRGVKKGYQQVRQISVSDLWIIDPD